MLLSRLVCPSAVIIAVLVAQQPARASALVEDHSGPGAPALLRLAQSGAASRPARTPVKKEEPKPVEKLEKPYDINGLPLDANLQTVERVLKEKTGDSFTREESDGKLYFEGAGEDGKWYAVFDGTAGHLTQAEFSSGQTKEPDARRMYASLVAKYGMPYHIETRYGDQLAAKQTVFANADQKTKDATAKHNECTVECCGGAEGYKTCQAAGKSAQCVNDCFYPKPPLEQGALLDWLFEEDPELPHRRLVGRGINTTFWTCSQAEPVDVVRSNLKDHNCYVGTTFVVTDSYYRYDVWYSAGSAQ